MISGVGKVATFDGILERGVQFEDYLFDKIAEVLVIDSAHVADPSVSVRFSLFAQGEGQRPVDVGEHDVFTLVVVVFLDVHAAKKPNLYIIV